MHPAGVYEVHPGCRYHPFSFASEARDVEGTYLILASLSKIVVHANGASLSVPDIRNFGSKASIWAPESRHIRSLTLISVDLW